MRMVRPQLAAPQVTIAEEQEEFKPITAALVTHPLYAQGAGVNTIVLAFRPNTEDRERLARGDDIYVSLLTFGRPMPGIIVGVGAEDAAAIYGVKVEK